VGTTQIGVGGGYDIRIMKRSPHVVSFERPPIDPMPQLYVQAAAEDGAEAVARIQRPSLELIQPQHCMSKKVDSFISPHDPRTDRQSGLVADVMPVSARVDG